MILSESKIRSLVRLALVEDLELLKEDFLSSKVDSLESVSIDNKKFIAYGYFNYQGKESVMILANKSDHQFLMKKGAKLLAVNSSHNLSNHGNKFNQKVLKFDKKSSYAVPVQTKGIKFSSVKLDTGKASYADWAVEIGGILGAIPGIGNAADISSGIIAAIKDPPDYLIAAFSFICAIPAIGVGAAFARATVKKAGKEGAKGVAKALKQALEDRGRVLTRTQLSEVKQWFASYWSKLTSEARIKQIAELTNNESELIIQRLGETKKYVDEIIENVEVVGAAGKAADSGIDDFGKAVVKRTSARVIQEITTGQLRNVCLRWSKELAEKLPKQYARVEDLVGKVFKHPGGKDIVFKSFKEFRSEFIKITEEFGLSNQQARDLFKVYYDGVLEANRKAVQPRDIEILTDSLLQKMSKIKIKILTDAEAAAAEGLGEATRGMMKASDPPTVFINYALFAKEGLEKNIQETMEHEIVHAVDKLMLTVLVGGDEVAKELINSKNIKMASDLASDAGKLVGSSGDELSEYVYRKSDIEKIISSGSKNLDGLTNWQYYLAKARFSADEIAYVSKPAEMFVRVQRISYWLKANGFKPNQWEEFFRRSSKEMMSEVPDADYFEPFFDLFKIVADGKGSEFQTKVVKDLYQVFDSLI